MLIGCSLVIDGFETIFEWILDIGVHNRYETLLFLTTFEFYFYIFDLKYPPNQSKIFKIMIVKTLVNGGIFAKVIGSFEKVEVSIVLLKSLLPELTFIELHLGLLKLLGIVVLLVHAGYLGGGKVLILLFSIKRLIQITLYNWYINYL